MNTLFGKQEKMFDEIDRKSFDVDQDRVEKLKELFPNIVSDGKVDWKALKLLLGENVTEEDERYRFTWNGKSKAIRETSIPTSSTLRPDKESSKNWDATENLYIEGDNLEVLKVLQNSYNGKIKMIYIDPPYNTGNDFIYEDDFTISAEEVEKQEGLKDRKGATQTIDRLTKNSKDSAKYHTNWLNMMYPRLSIARDLLKDDGVIFISIDDFEIHNLRKVCDEVFGGQNYIETLKWKRKKQPSFLAKHTAKVMEYVLIYAKSYDNLEKLSIEGTTDLTKKVINISNEKTTRHFKSGVRVKLGDSGVIKAGVYKIKTMEVEYKNDVYYENGKTTAPIDVVAKFLISQEKINSFIDEELLFITSNKGLRRDVSEEEKGKRKSITDLLLKDWGDNQESDNEFVELFNKKYFDYTKPINLIKNLIKSNHTENEITLDFFSGSATTAHSIMQLNAEDSGNRKYIMVQLDEKTEEKSQAYKDGYKNICEIGKERIRRAGEKILTDNSEKDLSKLDIGFKTFKIDTSNFNEWDVSYEAMMKSVKESSEGEFTTYKTERTHLDLVYEIMLKEGLQLTEAVEEVKIGENTIYKIADGVMYIFLGKLNNEVIENIVEMKKEAQELFGLDNPSIVLNETYLDTEIKSNAKKNFEANGITDIKTL